MKHLIFDIGGVIVYPRLGQWNIPYGAEAILGPRYGDIGSNAYLRAYEKAVVYLDESRRVSDIQEEYCLRRQFIESLDRDMRWHMTGSEISALADDFTHNIDRYGFFEDVRPWLGRWQGRYSMSLLSDALPSILVFIEQYGISEYFDAKVISAHVGATKPSQKMYRAVLDRLQADPADCVFVDDRVCNLEGAVQAGMSAIQMARKEFMPDTLWKGPIAHDFEELNAIFESGELF